MAEQGTHNPVVVGSNPTGPTNLAAGALHLKAFSRPYVAFVRYGLETLPSKALQQPDALSFDFHTKFPRQKRSEYKKTRHAG